MSIGTGERAIPRPRATNFRANPTVKRGHVGISKRVSDRFQKVWDLRAALEKQGAEAAERLGAKIEGELRDGETPPDLALALELMVRRVETALDELEQADLAYWKHASKRRRISEACNEAAKAVQPLLVEVRRAIELRFGRHRGREVHGLKGNTLRKPTRLYPQLGQVVARLADQEPLPEPVRPGPPGERKQWLAMLEPGLVKLKEAIDERRVAEIVETALREERDTELESFDFIYGDAVAFLRAVYWLVGYSDRLVDVRPRNDRRRRIRKARLEQMARAEGLRKPSRS